MNKKQNLLAIALSASFVLAGANVAEANDQDNAQVQNVGQVNAEPISNQIENTQEDKGANLPQEGNQQATPTQAEPVQGQASANEEKSGLDALINEEGIKKMYGLDKTSEEAIQVSEEKPAGAQKAEPAEPNYSDDEKKIKNYSGEERYRSTQMEQGKGPAANYTTPDEMDNFIDGYRYHSSEPGAGSPDKTKWGIEIEIDKEKGQRTYTDFYFTNSGNMGGVLDTGNVSANEAGEKIAGGEKDPNYKATSEIEIDGSRAQRNLNLVATEEDIKHINDIDNTNTTMAWQGKYLKDNPNGLKATEGGSALFSFTVNPWPNENDKLSLIKLNGSHDQKEFVQGQTITTGVKVENLDANARERLVGQVYNPNTGEVVKGAKAYIDENDKVVVKMPDGALMKDANDKTVINEDSIFNTPDYKNLQYLEVKFFARPRTADEFKAIVEGNGAGFYTGTGAGAETIKHKGQDITIDKQGIDRYDHYNLIGDFKLKLDDTRYYDQDFKDQKGNTIDEHSSTRVLPGEEFSVEIKNPAETGGTQKTGAEMDGAYSRGEASGKLKEEFLDIANKQIADDLGVDYEEFITSDDYADKRWTVVGKSDNISKFTIKAPKQAKAGDFLALPVEYTYTNGSTDTHWFHFVVQETNNNRPEYLAEVGPQGNVLVNNPIIPKKEQDLKKNQPESYELIGNTFKDNKGNVWNVSINQKTGAVTATLPTNLPDGKEISGGEKLTVPVKVKYTDKDTGEERTEEIKAQFIATKTFKTNTNERKTSDIPFETKYEYNSKLAAGTVYEKQKGEKGELTITFKQDTLNGKKGIFDENGNFIEGINKIDATVTKKAVPRIIEIGTKKDEIQLPPDKKIEIPFGVEYELDDTLEKGKEEVTVGEKGEVTVTVTQDAAGNLTINSKQTKAPVNKIVKIGTKTTGTKIIKEDIPFEVEVKKDPTLKKGEWKYNEDEAGNKLKGEKGEQEKTLTIVNSKVTETSEPKVTKQPKKAVILVGDEDFTGTVKNIVTKEIPYAVKVVENPNLDAGKSNVKQQGKTGSRTYEYTGQVVNGALKEGTSFVEKEVENSYKEPVEHIIEIGTKPTENMCPVNPEKPQEPEKPHNPEKPVTPEEPAPETPGEDEPELPETPDESPENPDEPGEENPEKPGEDKPGKPNEPGTPGEDKPNEPGTPGETPEKPEKPETPESPKKDPKKEEKIEEKEESKENVSDELSKQRKDRVDVSSRKSTNPKTGIGSMAPIFTSMGISIAGLLATKKKKKEDEE